MFLQAQHGEVGDSMFPHAEGSGEQAIISHFPEITRNK